MALLRAGSIYAGRRNSENIAVHQTRVPLLTFFLDIQGIDAQEGAPPLPTFPEESHTDHPYFPDFMFSEHDM